MLDAKIYISDYHNSIHYGKIGPIDEKLNLENISKDISVFQGEETKIVEVYRIQTYKNAKEGKTPTPTPFIKIKFDGPLPRKVTVGGYAIYTVYPWISPVLRCYNCWMFGHGTLTCRSKKRCSTCSGMHDSLGCTNPPWCYFCNGSHVINYKKCPTYLKALEISKNNAGTGSGFKSPLNQELRKLNNTRYHSKEHVINTSKKKETIPSPQIQRVMLPPISNKSYSQALNDEMSDLEETPDCDDNATHHTGLPQAKCTTPNTKQQGKPSYSNRYFRDSEVYDYTEEREERQHIPNKESTSQRAYPDSIHNMCLSFVPLIATFFSTLHESQSYSKAFSSIFTELFQLISSLVFHNGQE